ncbi:MAG TPA: SagB/ThcOx family dehydrogenase [Gammaproteobacteria bacterium]|jgi:SagB-type dehydrogenase family enzyme|nr:SagB/ThcOx family dehydrogenase [Gammaproteobacteria bacterium]
MRFRRAATLSAGFDAGEIVVHNFLTQDRFTCSLECLQFLAQLDEWHKDRELFRYFPDTDAGSLAEQVAELVGMNALVVEGTPQAERDETYRREWLWGTTAGLFHFGVRNTPFMVGKPARQFMRKRKTWRPSPPLHQTNSKLRKVTALPHTDLEQEPFALMRRRRSQRDFDGRAIGLQALADCLFAGNGIVDFFTEDADYGRLPIAMTPSGGARNPYELYVYARNVTGLEPGFYHYGALKRDLGLVRTGKVKVPEMLGGQKWPAQASAIVFLVAHFPRTMWKYHLPMAYRIVMMEAGFICQNIALAATAHGLSAVPSGALKEDVIEGYLGTPPLESAVVFTMSLGKPKPERPSR